MGKKSVEALLKEYKQINDDLDSLWAEQPTEIKFDRLPWGKFDKLDDAARKRYNEIAEIVGRLSGGSLDIYMV